MTPAPKPTEKEVRFVSRDETGFTVNGRMTLLNTPVTVVYDILTDFDACARIYHNVSSSSAAVNESGQKVVRQTCRWKFLAFGGSFDLSFEVFEDPGSTVDFKLTESSFLRSFQGQWRVLPFSSQDGEGASATGDGSAADSCTVEHVLLAKPLRDLPWPLGRLANGLFVSQVSKLFDDLAAEAARRLAAPAPEPELCGCEA